jgi:hypothetical protein
VHVKVSIQNGAFCWLLGNGFSKGFFVRGWLTAPSRASRSLIKPSAALSYLREGEAGDRVPFDLYGATPVGPWAPAGAALGASGPAKPTGVFVALLSGRRGMIAVLAVAIGGRSLPGGDGRARPTRQPAGRTSFAPGGAPSGRESTLTVAALVGGGSGVDTHPRGSWWGGGGPGGVLPVTFCAGGGPESAPRRPVPQRSSSTSPGRTTVASSHPA